MKVVLFLLLLSINLFAGALSYGPLSSAPSAYTKAFKAPHALRSTDSLFFNPATLPKQNQFHITYSKYFYDATKQWAVVNFAPISFGYLRYAVSDIIHSNSVGDRLGTFSYTDDIVFLGYQHKMDDFYVGFNMKSYTQKALGSNTGLFADIGLFYEGGAYNIGVSAKNVISEELGGDKSPTEYVIGLLITGENVIFGTDMVYAVGTLRLALGVEYQLMEHISILSGIDSYSYTFGFKLNLHPLIVSYNYQPHDILNIHEVGLTINF